MPYFSIKIMFYTGPYMLEHDWNGQNARWFVLVTRFKLVSSHCPLIDFLSKQNFKSFPSVCSSTLQNNLFSLWHSRLEHPSNVKVQSLSHVLPFLQHCCNKTCTVCPLAKQKRLPFPFDNKRCSFF